MKTITKKDLINYLKKSPENLNFNIFGDMLDEFKNISEDKLISLIKRDMVSFEFPDGITSIGDNAFNGCDKLKSINIPDSITSIGNYAFSGCIGLTNIVIPDSVTDIGQFAFYGCLNLEEVVLGNNVTDIKERTFLSDERLRSIVIPKSVTTIGDFAFPSTLHPLDVYYTGTEEEWSHVSIGSNNNAFNGAVIHYNYTPSN